MATETAEARELRGSATPQGMRSATPVVGSRRRFARRRVVPTLTGALARLVWMLVAIVDAMLVLDFVFRLIGAGDEGFVHAVFAVGSTLASPFNGIFASVAHQFSYVLTWSDLVALVLCTFAGWVIVRLIRAAGPRERLLV
jgi:hypothetical protein